MNKNDLIPIRRELLERLYEAVGRGDGMYTDELRELRAALAAPVQESEHYSTTSDRYRAELYDEVWQKARDMGYGNVTMALDDLAKLKAAPAPTGLTVDDVRAACQNAADVFADEANAAQCREVAEYMREVLLVDVARKAAPSAEGAL